MDYISVAIWEPGRDTSVFGGSAGEVSGKAVFNLEGLAPGTYYCSFLGMKNDPGYYVTLYKNPKQLFRWDGSKGEFLS